MTFTFRHTQNIQTKVKLCKKWVLNSICIEYKTHSAHIHTYLRKKMINPNATDFWQRLCTLYGSQNQRIRWLELRLQFNYQNYQIWFVSLFRLLCNFSWALFQLLSLTIYLYENTWKIVTVNANRCECSLKLGTSLMEQQHTFNCQLFCRFTSRLRWSARA